MPVNLQQPLTKGDYFTTDTGNLYFVVDLVTDGDYLVEDCKSLDMVWIMKQSMDKLDYTPVIPSTRCGGVAKKGRALSQKGGLT